MLYKLDIGLLYGKGAAITAYALIGILFFSSLLLGLNRDWLWPWVSGLLFLLTAYQLLSSKALASEFFTLASSRAFLLLLLALFGIHTLQLLALPTDVIATLSPTAWQAYNSVETLGGTVDYRLSINPEATLLSFMKWATFLLLIVLGYTWAASKPFLETIFKLLVFAAIAHLAWGIFVTADALDREAVGRSHYLISGGFVNPNHFASYLGMVLPIALLTFQAHHTQHLKRRSFFKMLRETSPAKAVVLVMLVISLLFSGSRGAALSAFLTGLIFLVLTPMLSTRLKLYISAGTGLFLVATFFVLGNTGTIARFVELGLENNRVQILSHGLNTASQYLWLGAGGGNFADAFAVDKPPFLGPFIYNYAHNHYVELLIQFGVVISTLIVAFYMWWLLKVKSAITQVDREDRHLLTATGLAVLFLLLHGLFDFALEMPTLQFHLALLLGIGLRFFHRVEKRAR